MSKLPFSATHGPMDRPNIEQTRAEIRAIGKEINEKFGFEGMQTADNALFALGERASAAVDHMWSGIGDYVA
jgi:hypothetical protein